MFFSRETVIAVTTNIESIEYQRRAERLGMKSTFELVPQMM